jgi:hypothetical protein
MAGFYAKPTSPFAGRGRAGDLWQMERPLLRLTLTLTQDKRITMLSLFRL